MLGLERIADLVGQSRAPLALRFGPEIGRRLDQAFGRLAEPITPLRAAELVAATRAFAEPIGAAETIARYLARLVDAVAGELGARGLGARRLDLVFSRVDMGVQAIRVGTSRPTRDPVRLTRLLGERIETVDPGFGIERMTLTVSRAEPMAPRQTVSSLIAAETPDLSDLIDALSNRLGAHLILILSGYPGVQAGEERESGRRPLLDLVGGFACGGAGTKREPPMPTLYRAFRYKLAPTADQRSLMRRFAGVTRLVYNLALEQRRDWSRHYRRETGKPLNYVAQARELTALRAEYDWIAAVHVTPQQQALRDLEKAYANFFAGRAGYPSPRRKGVPRPRVS